MASRGRESEGHRRAQGISLPREGFRDCSAAYQREREDWRDWAEEEDLRSVDLCEE